MQAQGHEFPLRDGEHIVGREANAAICLDSPNVSRRHARFVVKGRSATLEDLGSKNGSFVRGVRLSARQRSSRAMTRGLDSSR